jgi:hypothetical protein
MTEVSHDSWDEWDHMDGIFATFKTPLAGFFLFFVGVALETGIVASPSGSEQKMPALVMGAITPHRTNPFNPINPNETSVSVAGRSARPLT